MTDHPKRVMWVRGHTAVAGNEVADRKASMMAYRGRVGQFPDQVTPTGIRQEYPTHSRPKHLAGAARASKG